jgi:hypothetical protein
MPDDWSPWQVNVVPDAVHDELGGGAAKPGLTDANAGPTTATTAASLFLDFIACPAPRSTEFSILRI